MSSQIDTHYYIILGIYGSSFIERLHYQPLSYFQAFLVGTNYPKIPDTKYPDTVCTLHRTKMVIPSDLLAEVNRKYSKWKVDMNY